MMRSVLAAALFTVCAFGFTQNGSGAGANDIVFVGNNWLVDRTGATLCDPVFGKLAEQPGWGRFRWLRGTDALSKEDLENARLVFVNEGVTFSLDAHDVRFCEALEKYVRAGGGLVIVNTFSQMFSRMEICQELMRRFGGKVLMESVVFPKEKIHQIGAFAQDQWAYTRQVKPPFDAGVKSVLVRATLDFGNEFGCIPFETNADWKVALATEKGVKTVPFRPTGLPFLDTRIRPSGYDGSENVPVVGYRTYGKGRVVWFGISEFLTRYLESDTLRDAFAQICEKGVPGGEPSDLARFCLNLFNWAGANAADVTAADVPALQTRADEQKHLSKAFKVFKGVIGPRTTYSTGRSTPQAYVAKAKALGHDFIVFLEDLAHITPTDYERLRAYCRDVSDDTFTAWAGYTFEKDNGNCQYAFSTEPIYPGDIYLTSDRKFRSMWADAPERGFKKGGDSNFSGTPDLYLFYGMLGFKNNLGWYKFHDSPYKMTDNRNVSSMGIVTRVNGVTAETAFDAFAANNRTGQEMMPYALELMDCADYLTTNSFVATYGANGIVEFRNLMRSHGSHSGYPGDGIYGLQGVSNGPEIEFAPVRGDYAGNAELLYDRALAHWPYTLKVRSPNGIDAIELLDGDRVVRRWRANGAKTFTRSGAFANERQHYLWVRVTDAAGKIAFTRASNSETHLLRENTCNDQNNRLFYSSQQRPEKDAPPFMSSYAADTCLPDKGPWNGRVRPVGFFVFDKKYGFGGQGGFDGSPEDHPKMWLTPSVEYAGRASQPMGWVREFVAGLEGGPHVRPERIVASSDALVGDRVLDGVFAFDRRPVVHVWHSLFPVQEEQYADTRARCSLFIPKLDGTVAYQWEQTLTFKQPIPSAAGKPIVDFGFLSMSSHCKDVRAHVGGREIVAAEKEALDLKPGDFILAQDPVYGHLAVAPLAPIRFNKGRFVQMGDGSTYRAGTTFDCHLVLMGMHKFVSEPYAFAKSALAGYGLSGASAYRAELTAGTGTPDGVCFDASADDGALVGCFGGLKALSGTLGLRLAGMNDNWSAVVSCPRGMRLVPVEAGVAYAALRNEESDVPLFVGHPIRANNRALVLSLTCKPGSPWRLEVHNPTAQSIAAHLETDPRFTAFTFVRDVTLAAGESQEIDLNK